MNWYSQLKISMALPIAEDYPYPYGKEEYKSGDLFTDYAKYNTITINQIDSVLKDPEILNKYGPLKYIGSGTEGIAYYSKKDDAVIKLTKSESEFENAKNAKEYQSMFDEKTPHVAQIYDAYKIKEYDNLYVIVMEKLETLNPEEQKIVRFIALKNQNQIDALSDSAYRAMEDVMLRNWKSSDFSKFSNPKKFIEVMKKLYDMSYYLNQELGMELKDIHEHNIGKRPDGTYVLLDFGGSF